jgi:hypothetical protein
VHIEKFRFAKLLCPVFLTSPLVDWPLFLVRAYVLSSGLNPENLVRAETALNELLDSIPPDDVSTHSPALLFVSTLLQQKDVANQELHWWKLAVLRRRNASEDALFESEP